SFATTAAARMAMAHNSQVRCRLILIFIREKERGIAPSPRPQTSPRQALWHLLDHGEINADRVGLHAYPLAFQSVQNPDGTEAPRRLSLQKELISGSRV